MSYSITRAGPAQTLSGNVNIPCHRAHGKVCWQQVKAAKPTGLQLPSLYMGSPQHQRMCLLFPILQELPSRIAGAEAADLLGTGSQIHHQWHLAEGSAVRARWPPLLYLNIQCRKPLKENEVMRVYINIAGYAVTGSSRN